MTLKITKSRIFALCIAAVLIVMTVAGASLAYLTDEANVKNTFTVGNVRIQLNEYQRNAAGTALESFKQNKNVLPLVGNVDGAKDKFGMPLANNYVDKIVTVKNIGENDAYVRVLVALPSELVGGDSQTQVLHWSTGDKFRADGLYNTIADPQPVNDKNAFVLNGTNKDIWKLEHEDVILFGDGIKYDIYSFTYAKEISKNVETTYAPFVGFWLDSQLDNRYDAVSKKIVYTMNGSDISYDLTKGISIPVFAQAVQKGGFDTATQAFAAANITTNPWAA